MTPRTSAGSPRARGNTGSPESTIGVINPALAMGRALSLGLHPVNVSYIFYGADGNQSPSTPGTMTTPVSMTSPAALSTSVGLNPATVAAPAWPYIYHPTYYPAQYGGYVSSNVQPESESGVHTGSSQIYNAATTTHSGGSYYNGSVASHPYGLVNYSGITPYVHPPQNTNIDAPGHNQGHGEA